MANNYLLFSEVIEELSEEEMAWFSEKLGWEPSDEEIEDENFQYPAWYDKEAQGVGFDYDLARKSGCLYFISEEYGNLDTLGILVREFLEKFRPNDVFTLTYAETCSRSRVGEFGGGAMVVSRLGIEFMNAHDFVSRAANRLRQELAGEGK